MDQLVILNEVWSKYLTVSRRQQKSHGNIRTANHQRRHRRLFEEFYFGLFVELFKILSIYS